MIILFFFAILIFCGLIALGEAYYERDWPRDTGKFAIISLILFLLSLNAFGQNVRWDLPVYTTQSQGGNLLPVYAIPGALISFYSLPGMTLANTYNSATSISACPTGAQVVLQNSSVCVSSADPFGNMGSWFLPGQYMATIKSPFKTYNYSFTIGGGSPGSVSSVSVVTANGFQGTVATPATTPAISINVDSTHFLPTNTGLSTTFLSGAATYLPPFTLGTTGTSGPSTFAAGVLNIPQYATVYPGFGIANSTGSAWGTSYLPQGTDPKLLTAGTVSGSPGTFLCTDANLGATTSGCSFGAGITGSGTTNFIPKFTGSTVVGNSALSDNGTTVTSTEPIVVPAATLNGTSTVPTGGNLAATGTGTIIATNTVPLYTASGTLLSSLPHAVIGSGFMTAGTLSVTFSGAAIFTANNYSCTANDGAAASAIHVFPVNGTAVQFLGPAGDTAIWICMGN